jgi:predicted nucleic acid-binding protein
LKGVVLDASVILKWYLPDEDEGEEALDLLKRYVSDDLEIIAPSLLEYEAINSLMVARKRTRLSEDAILSTIEGLGNLRFRLLGFSGQYARLINFCNTLQPLRVRCQLPIPGRIRKNSVHCCRRTLA